MAFTAMVDRAAGYALAEADWDAIKTNFNAGTVVKLGEHEITVANTIGISGIDQTFAHLMLVAYLRANNAAASNTAALRLNGDTGTNYDYQHLDASAATAGAAEGFAANDISLGLIPAASAGAGLFSVVRLIVPRYAYASGNKVVVGQASSKLAATSTNLHAYRIAGFWRSSAAITSISIRATTSNNFAVGSFASLYGMA